MNIRVLLYILTFYLLGIQSNAQEKSGMDYAYIFPEPGAKYVHPNATIILRFKNISPAELTNLNSCIKVSGEKSGSHSGKTIIASDKRTLIFEPYKSFTPEETVSVCIEPQTSENISIFPLSYEFSVLKEIVKKPYSNRENNSISYKQEKSGDVVQPVTMPNGVSVPTDFPHVNITVNINPSTDYIFINSRSTPNYNIIFNTAGEPVWYWRTEDRREDFKVQPNGWITMQIREGYDRLDVGHVAYTKNFEYIKSFHASNGYTSDDHEFYMLPDSGYFLIGKRDTKVDMSEYVAGGKTDATVTETCIQEFTADDELIFIWRAWGHFDIRNLELDDLTGAIIRFPHMNSIHTDEDGHILLSSRHLSEISKIHRKTGEFIWRMSGTPDSPNNDFEFVGDPLNGFRNQHSIQSLGNNRYTLFDNGNLHSTPVSRAVEYEIDTAQMTATMVWEYRNQLNSRLTRFMGNAQRLPNGNTHINWAVLNELPVATEVTPEGEKVFEMWFEKGYSCYRSFRFPWDGICSKPYLIIEPQADNLTLIFNKFGDDNIDYYNIYGGTTPNPTSIIDTSHTTLKQLKSLENGVNYYFRVTAVDQNGVESDFSDEENINLNITQPGNNLIINGDFSDGLQDWGWKVDSSATAEVQIVDGACNLNVQNGGKEFFDVQLIQNNILLIQGQNYLFEFDAWADEATIVEIRVTKDSPPFTNYSKIYKTALTSTPTSFSYAFNMEESTDNNARVVVSAGASDKNINIDKLSLKIDVPITTDVSLYEENNFLHLSNYPNPFSQSTTISYTIPKQCLVKLNVFDGFGRVVDVLVNQEQEPGNYKVSFKASELRNGIYYYKIEAGDFMQTGKMLLMQ